MARSLLKQKQLDILTQLRGNAREKLTQMSKTTGIPVSTIYENLKQFEDDIICKHTSILDFKKLGFDLKTTILIKAEQENKETLKTRLATHHHVNNVIRISNGYDYMIEAIFTDMNQLHVFLDEIDSIGIQKRQEYYMLEDIKREGFLSTQTAQELLQIQTR